MGLSLPGGRKGDILVLLLVERVSHNAFVLAVMTDECGAREKDVKLT